MYSLVEGILIIFSSFELLEDLPDVRCDVLDVLSELTDVCLLLHKREQIFFRRLVDCCTQDVVSCRPQKARDTFSVRDP